MSEQRGAQTEQGGTVWLVDDDAAVRRSITFTLEQADLAVRGFESPLKFLDAYEPVDGECLLLDLQMPGATGIEVAQRLRAAGHQVPIIMITAHGDVPTAVQAMRLGAVDFIQKPLHREPLLTRVREAVARSRQRAAHSSEQHETRRRLRSLSPRERELLDYIVAGRSNKQVAAELFLAEKTVANHRLSLMRKMQAGNAADLVRMVLEARDPDEDDTAEPAKP